MRLARPPPQDRNLQVRDGDGSTTQAYAEPYNQDRAKRQTSSHAGNLPHCARRVSPAPSEDS